MPDRTELALINAAKAWYRARKAGDEERSMRATQRLDHMVHILLDLESLQRQARKAQGRQNAGIRPVPGPRPALRLTVIDGGRRA